MTALDSGGLSMQDPRLAVFKVGKPVCLIGPDGQHWELEEIEALPGYLERRLPPGSTVFANNGVGDNLFLEPDSSAVMIYWHEGSEIDQYASHPEELLPNRKRPPSEHGPVFYSERIHDDRVQVLVGDHVEIKLWLFFWRGWQSSRIYYVPGLSPKNPSLEHGGLAWVAGMRRVPYPGLGVVASWQTRSITTQVARMATSSSPSATSMP